MRKGFLSFVLGVVLSVGSLTSGCSSDETVINKKDSGAGGKGGSGGSSSGAGGSKASGGSTGSGGSTAKGGAGGSSTVGSGGSGVGGGGGNGGTLADAGGTGGKTTADGGSVDLRKADAIASDDAVDAPLPGDDGGTQVDSPQEDVATVVFLDGGAVDSEGIDAAAVDVIGIALDAVVDSGVDLSEDLAPDAAADRPGDGPSCLEELVAGGYASGTAQPCSACQDTTGSPPSSLETQCKGMIDCLQAAACTAQTAPNNCWINCRNGVSGNQPATEACVAPLVAAACP